MPTNTRGGGYNSGSDDLSRAPTSPGGRDMGSTEPSTDLYEAARDYARQRADAAVANTALKPGDRDTRWQSTYEEAFNEYLTKRQSVPGPPAVAPIGVLGSGDARLGDTTRIELGGSRRDLGSNFGLRAFES